MLKRSGVPNRRSLRIGALATVAGLVTLLFAGVAGAQVTATTTTVPASTTTTTAAAGGVTPAGPVTATAGVSLQVTVTGNPATLGPVPGTLTGTVGSDGKLVFKKSGINFPQYTGAVGPVTAKSKIVATTDWTGVIDPKTGVVRLSGSAKTLVTLAQFGTIDCPIGPITLALSTEKTGGAAYTVATGKATLADPSFLIPAVPDGSPGCYGVESVINLGLSLPSNGGMTMTMTFSPKLSGSVVIPTTTTTTTVAPATTVPSLPRTGTSSAPLAVLAISLVVGGAAMGVRRRRPIAD